ncbi:LPXTG cell wall anchor domain-containing protein [Haloechinothrix salitolerans]|uniref:LPXTG cell wall anchor domain-containing protein n=1 Tax=Haloechinothrix salitolerans TaxID=926830 RepID=A0ABW2C9Q5_9PSEU
MTPSITPPRRRRWVSTVAVAVAAALTVTLTGPFGVGTEAEAAQKPTRCDEKWLGRKYDAPVAGSGIKGKNQPYSVSPENEWGDYFYDNPNHAFDGLAAPTPEKQKLAGNTKADINKWKARYEKTGNIKYRVLEIYARYGRQLKSGNRIRDFSRWLDVRLIGNEANRTKGDGFERKIVRDFKLVGPDWICQKTVRVRDPKTGKLVNRTYDAYNAKTKELVEFKSNGKHEADQFRRDKEVMRKPGYRDHRLRLITGEKTTRNTVNQYGKLNKELENERGKTNQVTVREQRNNGLARWRPNQYTRFDKIMNPDPSRVGTKGPINDVARRSGRTPERARQLQRLYNGANSGGAFGRGPGGIDFTTLELQYVGNPQRGKGIDYSFRADYVPDPDVDPGYGGAEKLQLASDAFFTWLALTPDKFWVNLNPDQPDTIMDSTFASTDAGRVLLEADLAMKYDFAEAINPEKREEAQLYWDTAPRRDGIPCFPTVRFWIEPKPAKVREQNGGIYILDAPLRVDAEWLETDWQAPGARECDLTEPEKRLSEESVRRWIMPEVEKRVNNNPEYADLRRVYASRVAAEWVRQQDAKKATDFREIINSNDVSRWPLRGENVDWSKHEVWQRYMETLREGIEWFELEYGGKVYNQGAGGVDFSQAPKRNVTKVEFDTQHPRTAETTKTSQRTETAYRNTETAFLGGTSAGNIDNGDPDPDPEPEPSPTPPPSDPPTSSPSNPPTQPSAPGGGGADGGDTPAPPDQAGGDLPQTGANAAIRWLAAAGAGLLAVGVGLTWWLRRRKTASEG